MVKKEHLYGLPLTSHVVNQPKHVWCPNCSVGETDVGEDSFVFIKTVVKKLVLPRGGFWKYLVCLAKSRF